MSIATLEHHVELVPAAAVVEPTPPQPAIELRGVSHGFGDGASHHPVLSNIDLRVEKGEFIAICGFSGSGKTTLAHLLAGLLLPDQGQVLDQGEPVQGPGPDRGIVFQNYALLPWLSVDGNIAMAVDRVFHAWPKSRRREHVERFINMVGLTPAANRRPHELSGGMRQRVSLARTLALKPQVLVLDEPLSALDALTRSVLQEQILQIWEEERQTCVMITNDVDEALLMSDRIVPLNPGPHATLGPSFPVDLGRPRDKAALNRDREFQRLRNQVTNYLVEARQRKRDAAVRDGAARVTLPDIQPVRRFP